MSNPATLAATVAGADAVAQELAGPRGPKPRERPSQLRPVQAVAQALTQGSKVISSGGAKMLPSRISGMPFSEVTTIT